MIKIKRFFIGIDLAWGETNPSALAVLSNDEKPELLECGLYYGIEEMVKLIETYAEKGPVTVGVDAPLKVPNETGNRETEKAFLRDFSRYRIGMLPVNRTLMTRHFGGVKGEVLLERLQALGFELSLDGERGAAEVYPHATIAVCFNDNRILPYKRKKGRSTEDVKAALAVYQGYLKTALKSHSLLDAPISELKGKSLKEYEDRLDGITAAYTLWFCTRHPDRCKHYAPEGEALFITPIPG